VVVVAAVVDSTEATSQQQLMQCDDRHNKQTTGRLLYNTENPSSQTYAAPSHTEAQLFLSDGSVVQ